MIKITSIVPGCDQEMESSRQRSIYVGRWGLLKDGVRAHEEFICSYATREELLLLLLAGRGEITYEAVGTPTSNQILL